MKTKLTLAAALAAITLNAERLTCYDTVTCSPPALQQTYTKALGSLCNRPGDPECKTVIQLGYYGPVQADVRAYVVGYQAGNPNPIYLAQQIVRGTAAFALTFNAERCDEYHTLVGHIVTTGGYSSSASVTVNKDH